MSLESLATSRGLAPVGAETLSRSLARAGLRSRDQPLLQMERGWPLSKIPLLLRCSDPGTGFEKPTWWSFYLLGSKEVPFLCRSALKNNTAFYLDDLHAVVQSFPADLQLSGVEQACHKKTALPPVRGALRAEGRPWRSLTAKILGYKSSRRLTIRYRLRPESGRGRTLFGKLYPAEGARRVVEIQRTLAVSSSRSHGDRFFLPVIAGVVEPWNAVLWRRAPGSTLFETLSETNLMERVAMIGRCLRSFHESDLQVSGAHNRRRELDTVQSWIRSARVAGLVTNPDLRRAHALLQDSVSRPDIGPLVPSHRDFFDKQILIAEDRCTLLDLELVSRAEPELDVANFLAHLVLRSLQRRLRPEEEAASHFVEGYSRIGPPLDRLRLRWYAASSLVRLACVYSFRAEWEQVVPVLAQAANRALEGESILTGESL